MASQPQQHDAKDAELNDLGRVAYKFVEYGANASRNLQQTFDNMTLQHWVRLVVIVGGYMLLRPQIMKFMGRYATQEMEKRDAMEKAAAKAKISPNELRSGKPAVDEEDEDEYYEGEGTGSDWGAKARTRQRLMLKKLMEAEERRKQEEDDDKDIADLLED
jgi:hypothetical protein